MAKKRTKTRNITITTSEGAFTALFKTFRGRTDKKYDFSGISALRQLLSNEKARILHVLKTENPKSIYELAKKLGRSFKAVREDLKILDKFGFIDFIAEKTGKREKLKPVLAVDSLYITLDI